MGFRFQNSKNQRAKSKSIEVVAPYMDDIAVAQKYCYRCRDWLPANLDRYFSNTANRDNLSTSCKECNAVERKLRRQKNEYNYLTS